MIPILYDKKETAFISNGLGRLRDCISAKVTEERNGIYELDIEYPVGGQHYGELEVGRIIVVEHDDTGDVQPFDIMSISKNIEGIIEVHCVHISYRLSYMTCTGKNINSLSAAFNLLRTAKPSCPFTFWTDKTSTGYLAAADGVPKTVRSMLGGEEGSILDAYGGEYEFDNFTVRLYRNRGQQRDLTIRYGVNMTSYEDEMDMSECFKSCIPYWTDGTETVVGNKQTLGRNTPSGRDECIPLDVSDKFEEKPSKSEVGAMGLQIMNEGDPTLPAQNITVSFIQLQASEEYKRYKSLLACSLCDTVRVEFAAYQSSGWFKIVKTVWDVLRERFDEMELGKLSVSLSEALGISNDSFTDSSQTFGPGESYNATFAGTLPCAGHITSSTAVVHFTFNLPKRLGSVDAVTVTQLVGAMRGVSGYVNGSSDTANLMSGYTVEATIIDPVTIKITITKSSAMTNVTNNTPVTVALRTIGLTFS